MAIIRRKPENKEEARQRAIQKEREKRRKKMLRTKYGQKPLKHAKKGIQSCMLAVPAVFLLILMLVISFTTKGKIGLVIGFAGLGTLILSGMGFYTGVKGFREREKNYITCKVGAILNGLVFIGLAAMFIRGMM